MAARAHQLLHSPFPFDKAHSKEQHGGSATSNMTEPNGVEQPTLVFDAARKFRVGGVNTLFSYSAYHVRARLNLRGHHRLGRVRASLGCWSSRLLDCLDRGSWTPGPGHAALMQAKVEEAKRNFMQTALKEQATSADVECTLQTNTQVTRHKVR